jgi:methionyl-tRNA formyltransferase
VLRYGPGSRAAARDGLRCAAVDILVIASFPHLLGDDVLGLAPRGALNVHMSLLPRHRGPDPLFWTYFADDRETGVTVHRAGAQADAGDILAQRASPLERAAPVPRTYERLARLGSELLLAALEDEARGRSRPRPQPAGVSEPRPRPGRPAIEPATLPAERVHHVLAGLGAAYPWLLRDARGGVLAHGPALGYDAAPRRPGVVEALEGRLVVHCADGTVTVARAPLAVRLRWAVRQTFRLTARAGVP